MKCLIIAAGKGSRLSSLGESKPLIQLHGKALIERVIHTAMKAGVKEFFVVTGFNSKKVQNQLASFARQVSISIEFIKNNQ